MKRLLVLLALSAALAGGFAFWRHYGAPCPAKTSGRTPAAASVPQPERKVFAHFMGCWPAANGALPHSFKKDAAQTPSERFAKARKNGYDAVGGRIVNWPLLPQDFETNALANAKLEIARALRAGIDGFAFDAWAGGDSAKRQLDTFFRAAEEMKADFGLTVCFDPSCHPHGPNDGTMLEQFIATAKYVLRHLDSPNLARFDGKPLFFGYYSEGIVPRQTGETGEAWRARVAEAWAAWRAALPCPVFLHGSLDAMANFRDAKPAQMDAIGRWAGATFDAVGGFLGTDNGWGMDTNLVAGVKAAGGEWSQPLFFQYSNKLGGIITGAGLDRLRRNWEAAIRNGSRLLQFVTWNDYGEESSMAPAYGTSYTVTRVNRHFAETWKTGRAPKVTQDEVHAVFRRALSTEDAYPFLSRRAHRPTVLEIDTFLTAPARVAVEGYGDYDAPAGYSFRQFPLREGVIRVAVTRGATTALDWTCPETVAREAWREDMTLAAYGSNYADEWARDFPGTGPFVFAENADDDGDGLPNWFEMVYFGEFPRMSTAKAADPNADPDGDGRTNRQECRDRTNPLVADAAGSDVGFVWRLADLKEEAFVTNPFKDRTGHARWYAAYKYGPARQVVHDGDYTVMDWAGGAAKARQAGTYAKNPWGGYGGGCSVSTNGTVALSPRQECLMLLGWKAPTAGTYACEAVATGGKGHGSQRLSLEQGTRELDVKAVKGGESATLRADGVALKAGEMLWFAADARDSWGMQGVRIEKFNVKRMK